MRKLFGIVSAVSALLLVGCAGDVDESTELADDGVSDATVVAADLDSELETEALASSGDDNLIAGWCDFQNTWSSASAAFEAEVIKLVNQRRAVGASCGGIPKAPVPPLALNTKLRCASRFHSRDMVLKNFVSHTGSNGSSPAQRMYNAGYSMPNQAENIAASRTTPSGVVASWMASPNDCNNIMNGAHKNTGVGYYPSSTALYNYKLTQKFGNGF